MGLPMARRLRDAGFSVLGLDVRPAAAFGDFAGQMVDAAAFAERCDVIVSVVRDEAQTHDLLFDRQAVCAAGRARTVVISSTLAPRVVGEVRARLDPAIALVDAPMSGAPVGAQQGTLTFMVGGDDAVVDACQPLFQAMGASIYRCGGLGHGMLVKVLNNYVAVSSVVAVRRVQAAARALDLDPARLREIMSRSSGATWFGDRFAQIDWAGEGHAGDNTIGILEKDLAAATDLLSTLPDLADAPMEAALKGALRALTPWRDDGDAR